MFHSFNLYFTFSLFYHFIISVYCIQLYCTMAKGLRSLIQCIFMHFSIHLCLYYSSVFMLIEVQVYDVFTISNIYLYHLVCQLSYTLHLASVCRQLPKRVSSKDVANTCKEKFSQPCERASFVCISKGEQVWTINIKSLLSLNAKHYKQNK